MLEKQVRQSIEELNKNKKQIIETNLELLKISNEITNSQIKSLESENKEENKEEIEKLKKELLDNELNCQKEIEEIKKVGNDIDLSEMDKFSTTEDVIEYLKTEITERNKEKLTHQIDIISETLTLNRLTDFNHKRTNSYLRKNYKDIMKDLQTKLGRDNKFIYPSVFDIKKEMKKLIHSIEPNLTEEELFKRCKEFSSIIGLHLLTINLKDEGMYVYYFLKNIYFIDNMELNKRLEFVKNLISILNTKIKK